MKERQRGPVNCSLYEARNTTDVKIHPDDTIRKLKEQFAKQKTPFSYLATCGQNDVIDTPLGSVPRGSILSYQLKDVKPEFKFTSSLPDAMMLGNDATLSIVLPQRPAKPLLDTSGENFEHLILEHRQFLENLTVTISDSVTLERDTVAQTRSPLWSQERQNRLTASNFGKVSLRKAPPTESFLRDIFNSKNLSNVPSIAHGQRHENIAKEKYIAKMRKVSHHDVTVYDCGLVINPSFPFLGATPDGKIYDPNAEQCEGILEIKCPFKYRDKTPFDAACQPDFFCELSNNELRLKLSSSHYCQVQGQLALAQVSWCDFVTYTDKGLNVERITFNEHFWINELYPKLLKFYLNFGIPFLCARNKHL